MAGGLPCRRAARNEILKATHTLGRIRRTYAAPRFLLILEALVREAGSRQRLKCLKAFGERIASHDPDRQTAEVQIRSALINHFNALGTAEIERLA